MNTIRRLLRFADRYRHVLILTLICVLAATGFSLLFPMIMKRVIDECIVGRRFDRLSGYTTLIVALVLVKSIFHFGSVYLPEYVSQKATYDLRNRLFDHIQRLSFTYHDEAETGQLISRSTSDVESIRALLGGGLVNFVANGIVFLGVLAICLSMNWKLALVALAPMPFLMLTVFKYGGKIRPLYTAVQQQSGEMTAAIQQNLMGIRVVKAFARESYEIDKFRRESQGLLECVLNSARASAFYGPLMDFIAAIGTATILWYGGMQVVNKSITYGEFMAFNTYLSMLIWPVRMTGWVVEVVQNAVASGDRVFEILDTHPETHLRDGKKELHTCSGSVEFRDVSFNYSDGSKALHDVNMKAEPGEMVAFVGATGSGKTTIISLIPRFYDAGKGTVLIDGVDVKNYRLTTLRQHIGIVAQEPFLFGETVRGNIAYARPDAPMEEVVEAAKAANIHEFIETLSEGYDTKIGERGVNLSGGQKQRMAIARALLMNPPILILDDSTSAVDTETEAMIHQALVSLTASRTTFVIAQRISSVKRANKIVVLEKGTIAEMGTHDELLTLGGLYSNLYRMQLGDDQLAAELAYISAK